MLGLPLGVDMLKAVSLLQGSDVSEDLHACEGAVGARSAKGSESDMQVLTSSEPGGNSFSSPSLALLDMEAMLRDIGVSKAGSEVLSNFSDANFGRSLALGSMGLEGAPSALPDPFSIPSLVDAGSNSAASSRPSNMAAALGKIHSAVASEPSGQSELLSLEHERATKLEHGASSAERDLCREQESHRCGEGCNFLSKLSEELSEPPLPVLSEQREAELGLRKQEATPVRAEGGFNFGTTARDDASLLAGLFVEELSPGEQLGDAELEALLTSLEGALCPAALSASVMH